MMPTGVGGTALNERTKKGGDPSRVSLAQFTRLKEKDFLMKTAKQIMTREVVTAAPYDSIATGYEIMKKKEIRHLPIVSGSKFLGMVTQSDILIKAEKSKDGIILPNLSLSTVLNTDVVTCAANMELSTIAGMMMTHKVDAIVVLQGHKLIGIITTSDILDQFCLEEELSGQKVMPLSFSPRKTYDILHR